MAWTMTAESSNAQEEEITNQAVWEIYSESTTEVLFKKRETKLKSYNPVLVSGDVSHDKTPASLRKGSC